MSFLDSVTFRQKDERVKQYLMPQRVVLTKGKVTAASKLLKEKSHSVQKAYEVLFMLWECF